MEMQRGRGVMAEDSLALVLRLLREGRPVSALQGAWVILAASLGLGLCYVAPVYSQDIYSLWPVIGVGMSLFLAMASLLWIVIEKKRDWSQCKCRMSLCMLFLAFCIRQYEENMSDLLQRDNSFVRFENKMLDAWLPGFHCQDFDTCFFNQYNVMAYNTVAIWPLVMVSPIIFTSVPLFSMCVCGVVIVSSCGHIVSSLIMLSYSPGTVASLLLVIPSAIYSAYLLCLVYFVGHPSVYVAGMLSGACCHAAGGALLFSIYIIGIFPEGLLPICLYFIFSFILGFVCRLYGSPMEVFLARKKREKDVARYQLVQQNLDENADDV